MLVVKNVYKSFGGLRAVDGVSLKVAKGSISGLIGPNGSGKTTLFNIISGFYKKDAGEIYFKGERIDDLNPYKIANKGLARTFQISKIPERMTVLENMLLAPKDQAGEDVINIFLKPHQILKQEEVNLEKALSTIELIRLTNLRNEYAGNLSGGQKKLLSLGRILMNDPDLILLDEITAGINPTLVKDLIGVIKDIQSERGKTFFLIEHNMKVIGSLCDKVYVMNFGKKIAEGAPGEIQKNKEVLEAYLTRSNTKSKRVEQ